jgi:transcriptional regulator with XRE-family HTH domain
MPRRIPPANLFGRRLREARLRVGLPQDKLGVCIGLDEESSSARISRYETGVHEPPFETAGSLAFALGVPVAYFYCDDDELATLLVQYAALSSADKQKLIEFAAKLARIAP